MQQHGGILLCAAMCLSVDITNGGLDFSKPPFIINTTLPFYNGFVGGSALRRESRQPRIVTGYRLCVYASGSLITDIFSCFTLTSVSCLHFGQNSGKFSSTVSLRTFTRVLLPQVGHKSHASSSAIANPLSCGE